jgi:hypothetical protein
MRGVTHRTHLLWIVNLRPAGRGSAESPRAVCSGLHHGCVGDGVAKGSLPVADPREVERRLWAAFARGVLVDLRTGDRRRMIPLTRIAGMSHAGCGLRL